MRLVGVALVLLALMGCSGTKIIPPPSMMLSDAGTDASDGVDMDAGDASEEAGGLVVNIDAVLCNNIMLSIVAPRSFQLGIPTEISSAASNDAGDDFSMRWSASGGHFHDEEKAQTTFTCTEPGWQTLTLLVTNEDLCSDALATAVLCVPPRHDD